jgi:hypothetical protein
VICKVELRNMISPPLKFINVTMAMTICLFQRHFMIRELRNFVVPDQWPTTFLNRRSRSLLHSSWFHDSRCQRLEHLHSFELWTRDFPNQRSKLSLWSTTAIKSWLRMLSDRTWANLEYSNSRFPILHFVLDRWPIALCDPMVVIIIMNLDITSSYNSAFDFPYLQVSEMRNSHHVSFLNERPGFLRNFGVLTDTSTYPPCISIGSNDF